MALIWDRGKAIMACGAAPSESSSCLLIKGIELWDQQRCNTGKIQAWFSDHSQGAHIYVTEKTIICYIYFGHR